MEIQRERAELACLANDLNVAQVVGLAVSSDVIFPNIDQGSVGWHLLLLDQRRGRELALLSANMWGRVKQYRSRKESSWKNTARRRRGETREEQKPSGCSGDKDIEVERGNASLGALAADPHAPVAAWQRTA